MKTQWEMNLAAEQLKYSDYKKYEAMYSKYENEYLEKRDTCFCGKLLTGFHAMSCFKFKTMINKRIINNWDKFTLGL